MHKPDIEETWLGPLLERHLNPVGAPGELQARIELPRLRLSSSTRRAAWLLAAAMVMVAIVWGFHLRGASVARDGAGGYRTEVRALFKTNTTLDVPLGGQRQAACLLCHIGSGDAQP